MKINNPVTQRELRLSASQKIVSSTDVRGRIDFVNDDFIAISGFSEQELLGKAHNIVRHPDMPPAAFKMLWDTAKTGRPWMGVVKNRCKNGDHYWVDAFVTPMKKDGKTIGYQSVRAMPGRAQVARADKLYRLINKQSRRAGQLLSNRLGVRGKLSLGLIASGVVGFSLTLLGAPLVSAMVTSTALSCALIWWQLGALRAASQNTKSLLDDPVARYVYAGRSDEIGQLMAVPHYLQAQQNTMIYRSQEAVKKLADAADDAVQATGETEQHMRDLSQDVDQVAAAMDRMTVKIQQVAESATLAAESTQQASNKVRHGQDVVVETRGNIVRLSKHIDQAESVIQRVADDSDKISSVVDVINSVAEQTNLIALNAAIEAARAGEHGRGFAVVADEVRQLASKTQSSANEIISMITSLQEVTRSAVAVIGDSRDAAGDSVEMANQARAELEQILENVAEITAQSVDIASSAEQQGQESEHVNQNLRAIVGRTEKTMDACHRAQQSNTELNDGIDELNGMIIQFSHVGEK